MTSLPEAFYVPVGGLLTPTALCIGPWDARFQHGGPPAALLARAALAEAPDGFGLARLTVDLLRPIPLAPLRARASSTRVGRTVAWLDAELVDADDRVLARAWAVVIRRQGLSLPEPSEPSRPIPPSPDGVAPFVFPFFPAPIAYHRGVEVRVVRGRWPRNTCTAWMRLTAPLVAGEPTAPALALIALADACNGLAPAVLDLQTTFINADLTVHLGREPTGDHFAFAARSHADPSGVGLVQAAVFDAAGEIGRTAQSLVIARR